MNCVFNILRRRGGGGGSFGHGCGCSEVRVEGRRGALVVIFNVRYRSAGDTECWDHACLRNLVEPAVRTMATIAPTTANRRVLPPIEGGSEKGGEGGEASKIEDTVASTLKGGVMGEAASGWSSAEASVYLAGIEWLPREMAENVLKWNVDGGALLELNAEGKELGRAGVWGGVGISWLS